jgi:hypothetical protein
VIICSGKSKRSEKTRSSVTLSTSGFILPALELNMDTA